MFELKKKVSLKAGNADVLFFVGFFLVLFLLWWASGMAQKPNGEKSKPLISVPKAGSAEVSEKKSESDSFATDGGIKYNEEGEPLSPWMGQVKISSLGSAKQAYDPDLEYIILKATGNKEPINITGWSLLNGRNRNVVASGIARLKGVANQVYLPEARMVYLTRGFDILSPIRLVSGDEVIITTGRTPYVGSYSGSFKTNKCLGYLEDDDEEFYPRLKNRCPDPEIEPGIEFVDNNCREFIEDMSVCHVPEFRRDVVDDDDSLSTQCRTYLRDHYNYNGCVANHINDKDFYTNQWRVFLNRPWEMWAKGDEVITLLDDKGLVVDRRSY